MSVAVTVGYVLILSSCKSLEPWFIMVSASVASEREMSGRQSVITGMWGENMQLQIFSACVLWTLVYFSSSHPHGGKLINSSPVHFRDSCT